jgi:hypothetical protein
METTLLDLNAAADGLRRAYDQTLSFPGVWDLVRQQVPDLDRHLGALGLKPDAPPTLDAPTGDNMTVARHLTIARDKAQRPPRLALVGAFSTGKSTLLNAILHSKAFDDLLERSLAFRGKLLRVSMQPTTGNVTELEISGEPLPEAGRPDESAAPFSFRVTYLSEEELRDMFRYFARRMDLRIDEGILRKPDWIAQLQILLPQQLAERYPREAGSIINQRNLIVLREVLETLKDPQVVNQLGQRNVPLGDGKAGLDRFLELQSRQVITPPTRWADVKPFIHRFHLVKLLQFRFPHPDFVDQHFSLFDFPGLGAGMHRDEIISQEFIPEANVILVPYLRTAVGGEAVAYILDTFGNRRAGMGIEALLERIYFVNNNYPEKSPNDPTNQVAFYTDFLMAAKNLMHLIVLKRETDTERQKAYYRKNLNHFIGCDGLVGGMYRADERGTDAEAKKSSHQTFRQRGFFDCPTDLATMERLSKDAKLNDEREADSFPLLASMLAEPVVHQAIAAVFKPFEHNAGIDNLIQRLREFVGRDAERLKAEDVREHLRRAAAPLAALADLAPPRSPGGISMAALASSQSFQRCLGFERRWQKVLDLWTKQIKPNPTADDPELIAALRKLEDAQLDVERRLAERIDAAVTLADHAEFVQGLESLSDNLVAWMESHRSDDGLPALGGEDVPGLGGSDAEGRQGLLRLDHTLVLYRYFLSGRRELLRFFHQGLFRPFFEQVAAVYLESGGGAWAEFHTMFTKARGLMDERKVAGLLTPGDNRFTDLVKALGPEIEFFIATPRAVTQEKWYLRKLAKAYLPEEGWTRCEGQFYRHADVAGKNADGSRRRLELTDWAPHESMPSTGPQLGSWLTRLSLLPRNNIRLQRRETVPLPELDEGGVRRVLTGIGLVEQGANLRFAEAGEDFWTNPLPQLTGKRLGADGVLHWNPVPFDPYAGAYGQRAAGGSRPEWLESIHGFLRQSFGDLAARFLKVWKDDYRDRWQKELVRRLEGGFAEGKPFWAWVDDNRQSILDINPLESRLLELKETLQRCKQLGLIETPAPRA